jgi:hypothetical protein
VREAPGFLPIYRWPDADTLRKSGMRTRATGNSGSVSGVTMAHGRHGSDGEATVQVRAVAAWA